MSINGGFGAPPTSAPMQPGVPMRRPTLKRNISKRIKAAKAKKSGKGKK